LSAAPKSSLLHRLQSPLSEGSTHVCEQEFGRDLENFATSEVAGMSASLHPQARPREVGVPFSLLLSKDLTPAAKFLWIRLRFDEMHPLKRSHHPKRLAKRACLARSTIYEALRQAETTGWLVPYIEPATGRRRWKTACPVRDRCGNAMIPVDLIRASHALRPQAILCYGFLQATPQYNGKTGYFKWANLRKLTGLHLRTIKRAVRALTDVHWIAVAQKHRKKPFWFRLQHADRAYKETVQSSLDRVKYVGEALMRSTLSLIVETRECEDGSRPDFLVNPASGEKMELDRYYPLDRVAFEFNGPQHYVATGRFRKKEVDAQRKRDRLKRQICKEKKIALVVVRPEDLTLAGMLRKVGNLLPRRSLRGFKETIRFLNDCGLGYQRSTASGH